jgi:hypothetical protein
MVQFIQPLLPFCAGHESKNGGVAGRGLDLFRVAQTRRNIGFELLGDIVRTAFATTKTRSAVIVTVMPVSSAVGPA